MPNLIVLACFIALCGCCPALAEPLARRADWGAAIMPPADGKPATIVRFREGSVLERAGLRAGDAIVAIDGTAVGDEIAFRARLRRLREGQVVRISARRGAEAIEARVTLPAMRRESIEGVELRYGEARNEKGYRVRTYTARPAGVPGKLPVVVFIPWLSCDAVENPLDADDGWSKMLRDVMRNARVQLVRI